MSPYSTSSPSIEQTRLYLTRPPSVAWTWWNRMSLSSVAEYSFTPILTRPNDTAPRQIDRMPPLPEPAPDPEPLAYPWPGQDRRIGAGGCPRQIDRRTGSPGRRTRPTGEGTPGADRTTPRGDGRRSSFCPVVALRGRRQPTVLDGVVHELEDIGARDHRHRQGRQPGRLGRGDVAEHEAGPHPLRQAERAGEQLADRVLHPAVLPHLLGDLRVPRGALEPGKRRADRAGDRVLRDPAGQAEGGDGQQRGVPQWDAVGQLAARGAHGGRGRRHQPRVDAHGAEVAGQRPRLAVGVLALLDTGPPADGSPDSPHLVWHRHAAALPATTRGHATPRPNRASRHTGACAVGPRVGPGSDAGHLGRPRPERAGERELPAQNGGNRMTQPTEGQTARDISLEDDGIPDLQDGVPEQDWMEDPQFAPVPGERPNASVDFGTTAFEQSEGESLTGRLDRELPDDMPDVRPSEDPSRPAVQLEQDLNTTPDTDSGTNRTADDIEATGDATVGGEGPEEGAVHLTDG